MLYNIRYFTCQDLSKKAKELERRGEESGIRRKNVIEMMTYSVIFLIYGKPIMHSE
jgi:hypothetical protein